MVPTSIGIGALRFTKERYNYVYGADEHTYNHPHRRKLDDLEDKDGGSILMKGLAWSVRG